MNTATTPNLPARLQVSDKLALAQNLAGAGLLPRHYQKAPANLLWAIEYAEALGVHPMAAITGIHVIDGKPTASAQLIGGLVRRAGHKLRVRFDRKAMVATAQIIRADDAEFVFESVWSMDRAKAAGLANKNVWKQYPDAMLKARAITEVARDACPEALFGVIYTPEELGAEVELDADGEIVTVIETKATTFAQAADFIDEAPGGTSDVSAFKKDLVDLLVGFGMDAEQARGEARRLWTEAGLPMAGRASTELLEAFLHRVAESMAPQTAEVIVEVDSPFAPELEEVA